MRVSKTCLYLCSLFVLVALAACALNPATGERQFTAFMSTEQELRVGDKEHQKIVDTYGVYDVDDPLHQYVDSIGKRLAKFAERQDVDYKFFVMDTPMVNAFALPGGYVYVSRGLLNQANSEAELASVIAHEIAHITAKHIAERYSHAVVTQLGTSILSSAIDQTGASQALGLGSNLYLSSYSRRQESQSDEIGIRYLVKAGYHPNAMAMFLYNLQKYSSFHNFLEGKRGEMTSYFSTHPQTKDRIADAQAVAAQYQVVPGVKISHQGYIKLLDGQIYGDNEKAGFVRDDRFYHPQMDFTFSIPDDFVVKNQPTQIVLSHKSGVLMIFDSVGNPRGLEPYTYMTQSWLKSEQLNQTETIYIEGRRAATATFKGKIKGDPVTIRVIAIKWDDNRIFRFQIAIPQQTKSAIMDGIKRTTYSLRHLTKEEHASLQPNRIKVIKAKSGDTVATLSSMMPYDNYLPERFRVLNTMEPTDAVIAGHYYKIITDSYHP